MYVLQLLTGALNLGRQTFRDSSTHGRVVTVKFFSKFILLLPFLRTIELPFVVVVCVCVVTENA